MIFSENRYPLSGITLYRDRRGSPGGCPFCCCPRGAPAPLASQREPAGIRGVHAGEVDRGFLEIDAAWTRIHHRVEQDEGVGRGGEEADLAGAGELVARREVDEAGEGEVLVARDQRIGV